MSQNKLLIGIDLGTTYTSLSIYDLIKRQPVIFKENGQATSFASNVLIQKIGSTLSYITGNAAKSHSSSLVLYDAKRLIGKKYDEFLQMGSEKDLWSFDVERDDNGNCLMVVPNPLNPNEMEKFYPEEVSALILMNLIKKVKNVTNNAPIGNVVVTIPVKFTPAQRKATLRACQLAGLENTRLINEPSASLVEYIRYIEHSQNPEVRKRALRNGQIALVIDFGGGTLDICCGKIVNIKGKNDSIIEVMATDGDADLGGNHFDEIIKELFLEKIDTSLKSKIIIKGSDTQKIKKIKKKRLTRLMNVCEKAKIELSTQTFVDFQLEQFFGDDYEDEQIIITREEFEKKCEKELIPRFKNVLERVLKYSKLKREQINLVLPIGGTCRNPIVRKVINEMFPYKNQMADPLFDPLSAVANGAAYHAFRSSLDDKNLILREVLPYSIGVECQRNGESNCLSVFAMKGESIPLKRSATFCMAKDYQEKVNFSLFIGESRKTTDPGMICLGSMNVSIPPRTKKNNFSMEANINISESGIIEFEVKKVKDGSNLGNLEVSLDIDDLDKQMNEMNNHLTHYQN